MEPRNYPTEKYHFQDEYYYAQASGIGGRLITQINEVEIIENKYGITYQLCSVLSPDEPPFGSYYTLLDWKEIDGAGYWSMYYYTKLT